MFACEIVFLTLRACISATRLRQLLVAAEPAHACPIAMRLAHPYVEWQTIQAGQDEPHVCCE
jgi:hypothetical protein